MRSTMRNVAATTATALALTATVLVFGLMAPPAA